MRYFYLLFIKLFLIILFYGVYGDTIIVPKGGTLNYAINQASSGDTIFIHNDFKICNSISIDKSLTIIGENKDKCILNFMYDDNFIKCNSFEYIKFENITLEAMGILPHSLIFIKNIDSVSISNVDFIGGTLALFAKNTNIYINNCSFDNKINSVQFDLIKSGYIKKSSFMAGSGGIICNEVKDSLVIDSSDFTKAIEYLSLRSNTGKFIITNNKFISTDSSQAIINISDGKGRILFNKFFINNENSVVVSDNISNLLIRNNLFYNEIFGDNVIFSNKSELLEIYNNTFVNFKSVVSNFYSNLNFINNIAFNSTKGNFAIVNYGNNKCKIQYNDISGFKGFFQGFSDTSTFIKNFSQNPLFLTFDINDSLNFLCLDCNSPCIDAGDPDFDASSEINSNPQRIDLGFTGNTDRGCGIITDIDEHVFSKEDKKECIVFPMPFKDFVSFKIDGTFKNSYLRIYNIFGQIVYKKNININTNIFTINLNHLTSGIYLYNINNVYKGVLVKIK